MDIHEANDQASVYYRDLLMKQIICFRPDLKAGQDEYMAAFSEYLFKYSEAYPYNLTYLIEQHKSFCDFLQAAHVKYQTLKYILSQAKQAAVLQDFLSKSPSEFQKVEFVLNDFLVGNLADSVCLLEDFSVSGANKRASDDILTVCYKKKRRCVRIAHSDSCLEDLLKLVLASP